MDINDLTEMLKRYTTTPALAGYEKNMAYKFKEDISKYVDSVRIDKVGNVIGTIEGTDPTAPTVMVFAHMDNIGFFVKRIDSKGFLQVERNGSPQEKVLQGKMVVVESEKGNYINGIFCTKSYHVSSDAEKSTVDPLSSLYIDIGVSSMEEAKALGVEIGCPVMFRPTFKKLQGTRVAATFLDNRAGCTVVQYVASILSKNRPKAKTYIVGTVWEEFNLRGAAMANRTAKSDIAIGIDTSSSADTPDLTGNTHMRGGPNTGMFNFHGRGTLNGCIPQKGLFELAKEVAAEEGGFQRTAGRGGLTDTSYMQLENDGVACMDVGVPSRYGHSTYESVDVAIVERTGRVVAGMVQKIDSSFSLNRY